MIRRLSGKSCWLDVEPVFSGRSADSIFGRQHTRSRINKLYLLAYLHTMALSFFISLFVTYTDIANRQTTNIFFGFLGSHSSDAREKRGEKGGKKRKKEKWGGADLRRTRAGHVCLMKSSECFRSVVSKDYETPIRVDFN